jgi:hypothetical protein
MLSTALIILCISVSENAALSGINPISVKEAFAAVSSTLLEAAKHDVEAKQLQYVGAVCRACLRLLHIKDVSTYYSATIWVAGLFWKKGG